MSNISAFPRYDLNNLPECLRKFALDIESGKEDAIKAVICFEGKEEKISYKAFGPGLTAMEAATITTAIANRLCQHIVWE